MDILSKQDLTVYLCSLCHSGVTLIWQKHESVKFMAVSCRCLFIVLKNCNQAEKEKGARILKLERRCLWFFIFGYYARLNYKKCIISLQSIVSHTGILNIDLKACILCKLRMFVWQICLNFWQNITRYLQIAVD